MAPLGIATITKYLSLNLIKLKQGSSVGRENKLLKTFARSPVINLSKEKPLALFSLKEFWSSCAQIRQLRKKEWASGERRGCALSSGRVYVACDCVCVREGALFAVQEQQFIVSVALSPLPVTFTCVCERLHWNVKTPLAHMWRMCVIIKYCICEAECTEHTRVYGHVCILWLV